MLYFNIIIHYYIIQIIYFIFIYFNIIFYHTICVRFSSLDNITIIFKIILQIFERLYIFIIKYI